MLTCPLRPRSVLRIALLVLASAGCDAESPRAPSDVGVAPGDAGDMPPSRRDGASADSRDKPPPDAASNDAGAVDQHAPTADSHAGAPYHIAPPALQNPIVITMAVSSATVSGASPSQNNADIVYLNAAGKDVRIDWPVTSKVRSLEVRGARNIVSIGGRHHPTGVTSRAGAIRLEASGRIHFERMEVDMDKRILAAGKNQQHLSTGDVLNFGGGWLDAPVTHPKQRFPDIVIQKCRLLNLRGLYGPAPGGNMQALHGDLFQPKGGLGDVHVIDVVASTSYQGFYITEAANWPNATAPQKRGDAYYFRNFSVMILPNPQDPDKSEGFRTCGGFGHPYWITRDIRFFDDQSVWIDPSLRPGENWTNFIEPSKSTWVGPHTNDPKATHALLHGVSGSWKVGMSQSAVPLTAAGDYAAVNKKDKSGKYLPHGGTSQALFDAKVTVKGRINRGPPPGSFCLPSECGPGSPKLSYAPR